MGQSSLDRLSETPSITKWTTGTFYKACTAGDNLTHSTLPPSYAEELHTPHHRSGHARRPHPPPRTGPRPCTAGSWSRCPPLPCGGCPWPHRCPPWMQPCRWPSAPRCAGSDNNMRGRGQGNTTRQSITPAGARGRACVGGGSVPMHGPSLKAFWENAVANMHGHVHAPMPGSKKG